MSKCLQVTPVQRLRLKASEFGAATGGAAAIEFVFVLPLLVTIYLGAFEGSKLYEVTRKLNSATETMGDLVGRTRSVTTDEVDRIIDIAHAVMYPFKTDTLEVRVTAVERNNDGNWLVAWSRKDGGAGLAKGTPYAMPENLKIEGNAFFLMVDTEYDYASPILHSVIASKLTLERQFAITPRLSAKITCDDC